jgi:hypothetical protein
MNQFEQLIEYVINDEEDKARELFHDIVVEKSRQIYENLMTEEDIEEAQSEDIEEAQSEDMEESAMGGDAADDLIDDVEMEEESDINMEQEGDEEVEDDDMGDDEGMELDAETDDQDGSEPATKDDIMDLEVKLDELMAEFEQLMGDDMGDDMDGDDMGDDMDGDDMASDMGGDAIEVDDTEEMMPMAEAVNLKSAPKPVTSEEGGVNKKSTVAANAGAKGPVGNTVKPVKTGADGGGHHDAAPYKNTTKDLIGKVGNTPAQSTQKPSAVSKPKMGAGSEGQNNKSPLPSGTKG